MVKSQALITILNFITLGVALLLCCSIADYICLQCSFTLGYFQFANSVSFGGALLIFYVIIAYLTNEEIPPKLKVIISFVLAIHYILLASMLLWFFFKYYNEFRMIVATASACVLGGLHLLVGIMYTSRIKIKGVE